MKKPTTAKRDEPMPKREQLEREGNALSEYQVPLPAQCVLFGMQFLDAD